MLRAVCLASALVALLGPAPACAQETEADATSGIERFVDGVTVGGGLVFYQGDLDTNPNNNLLKFVASSNLSLFAGVDRRYAGGYSLGLELSYDRLAGERRFESISSTLSFSNNLVSLNAVGSLDTGLFRSDMIRLFLGAGPTLMASPQYSAFSSDGDPVDHFEERGTRVRPNLTLGLNVQNAVRIGLRALPTDYVDGYTGVSFPFDQMVFINVSYRFDLTD